MTVQPMALYDPASAIEVLFEAVEDGMQKTYVNEVINFMRHSDGEYESFVPGPGSREISIVVRSTDPSTLRRQLDYFRRSKKHLLLFLSTFDFVSEVVIKDAKQVLDTTSAPATAISFSCFGDIGMMMTALDSRTEGIAATTDANGMDGYASVLDAQNESLYFEIVAGDLYMSPANYMIIARAKSTGGVADDLTVRAYDSTASSATITAAHTAVVGDYLYYISEGSITATQDGHTMQIGALKATAGANAISVDMVAYVQSSQNIVIPAAATETTVTLSPTADNKIRSASATTVYATEAYVDCGASGAAVNRCLLQFDLSEIQSSATITSATLSLYWYYPAGATRTNDTVMEVYRPSSAWNTSYVCWNNRASGTAWSNAGGDWHDANNSSQGSTPFDSVTFAAATVPDNAFHDWDVTDLVQDYVDGTYTNTGFLLKAATEVSNYIAFYSVNYSGTGMRPKLTVVYEV